MKYHISKIISQFIIQPIAIVMIIIAPIHTQYVEASGNLNDAFSNVMKETGEEAGYSYNSTTTSPLPIISKVINVVFGLTGVIVFVLIIYGGILWMTAGGNDEQVKKAQKIIQRAVIGLIIVVLAYAITYFILKAIFANQPAPIFHDYIKIKK
ncbi:MAG TPA: pilin [Patescibacteria group bacterium]|nr:pilin [bacterium]HRT11144.1 pilin [Patescibacteria group bacterium]HRU89983.1 pilin [Patescibacteria group bacterium]